MASRCAGRYARGDILDAIAAHSVRNAPVAAMAVREPSDVLAAF